MSEKGIYQGKTRDHSVNIPIYFAVCGTEQIRPSKEEFKVTGQPQPGGFKAFEWKVWSRTQGIHNDTWRGLPEEKRFPYFTSNLAGCEVKESYLFTDEAMTNAYEKEGPIVDYVCDNSEQFPRMAFQFSLSESFNRTFYIKALTPYGRSATTILHINVCTFFASTPEFRYVVEEDKNAVGPHVIHWTNLNKKDLTKPKLPHFIATEEDCVITGLKAYETNLPPRNVPFANTGLATVEIDKD